MVAIANPQAIPQTDERPSEEIDRQSGQSAGIAKLAHLHAEAEETARLANLLGRSLYLAIGLPALALLTLALVDGVGLAQPLIWCAFVAAAAVAMLRAYFQTIGRPFERAALRSFASDMSAILLFAGFAWGAGAFLALPAGSSIASAILFAAVPGIVVAALLREREAIFLFLAPIATLTSFASVLRPFAEAPLCTALILIVCALIAGAAALRARRGVAFNRPALLPLP